jgi:drug/metabolite transporter (DMT)-like permease
MTGEAPAMTYLLIVSFIWAFSFGLIKGNLTGLDSNVVSLVRMAISLAVFLPLLRMKGVSVGLGVKLAVIGLVQYGLMYIAYIASYQYLKAYEVVIFTIFTPLMVTWANDIFSRRFHLLYCLTAAMAIVGTGIVVYKQIQTSELQKGFLLVQASNLCFALGQVWYRRVMGRNRQIRDRHVFGLMYLGAVLVTGAFAGFTADWGGLAFTAKQAYTLLYLGVLASGVCFFLWNYGATKVDAGALAILNNLKIPLGVACSIVFFHETTDVGIPRLLIGVGVLLAALLVNEWAARKGNRVRE